MQYKLTYLGELFFSCVRFIQILLIPIAIVQQKERKYVLFRNPVLCFLKWASLDGTIC